MGESQDINDYASAEEKAAQKVLGQLDSQAHEGALFADWSRQYCSIRLFKWLDEKIADSKNSWLTATSREDAEAVRLESRAYAKVKSWIYTQIKAGELASIGIKQFHNEGVELEGIIKLPPTRE